MHFVFLRRIALLFLMIGLAAAAASAQILTQSTLPILRVNTNGAAILDEPKTAATLEIVDNGPGQLNLVNDPANSFSGPIGIETRGQTSQLLSDKKPYGFETLDDMGVEDSKSLLGLPKESDWILLAPFSDKSLLRDVTAFELARRFDRMPYTPRTRVVELMVNGDYRGVYILTEKIKRDKKRVNVAKNNPENDLTGGYIIKIDKGNGIVANEWWESHVAPNVPNGQKIRFLYHYPKPNKILPSQQNYIQQYLRDFENALRSSNFMHPTDGYRKYAEVGSFIDFMLLNEVTRNVDGYRISTYLYKNRDSIDSRLYMGPVWDFNIALGNANYCNGGDVTGWAWNFNRVCQDDYWVIPFWWERMRQDSNFLIATQLRWQELRATTLSNAAVNQMLDSLQALVADGPVTRNFVRWPIMGTWQWPNNFVGNSWNAEMNYLREWTLGRLAWMDQEMPRLYTVGQFDFDPDDEYAPRVTPNPARGGEIVFDFYARKNTTYDIQLYDQQGRLVGDTTGQAIANGANKITYRHRLASGTYTYRISVVAQLPVTGKVVIVP
jgi:hypothetical protein